MQKKVLSFSLRASGWALSRLGKVFPGPAARLFFRMYMTPPSKKTNASQLEAKSRATEGRAVFTSYAFEPGPLTIATYRWGDPGKKVLLLHGWGSSGLGFSALTAALTAAGYEVISYDGPAHGSSEGRQTNLVQWMHVLDQYLEREGPIYAIVAHSVGALNAALTLARKRHQTPKLVLAAPPLSAPTFFMDTFSLFNIPPGVISRVFGLVKSKLKEDLHGMDLNHYIGQIAAEQILLIYDERDLLVRHAELDAYAASYPGLQTFKIKGEGHFRIMKNREVIAKILAFLGDGEMASH